MTAQASAPPYSRRGTDLTQRFRYVADALVSLPDETVGRGPWLVPRDHGSPRSSRICCGAGEALAAPIDDGSADSARRRRRRRSGRRRRNRSPGVSAPHDWQSSVGTVSARSRAFCSAFSRLGYDPMPPKIGRSRRWKSHRKPWHLTGAKVSMGGMMPRRA